MDRRPAFLRRPGPVAGAAAALGLYLVAPEIYTGTFSDLGTFLRVLALVTVLVVWVQLITRFVQQPVARIGLIWVPLGVVAAVVVWPYLRPPTEVDEAFPPIATAVTTDDATTETTSPPSTSLPPTTTAAPAGTAPPTTATAPPTTTPTTTAPPTTTVPPTTTTTVPSGPVELARSSFQGLTGHRGSGDAAVYRLDDQSILLRFEDVDIGSGPDLVVYVVPGADQRSLSGAVYVAPLTAERGNQNYTLPSGVDLTSGTWTVLVWCETFSVEVANATIT